MNTLKNNINPSIKVILFDEQLSSELAKNDFAEMRNLGFTRKKILIMMIYLLLLSCKAGSMKILWTK